MIEKLVTVQNEVGLHARRAAKFVQAANSYKSKVMVMKAGKKVDAKSIISLLSIEILKGTEITILAVGEDEEKAVNDLVELVRKFAEEE